MGKIKASSNRDNYVLRHFVSRVSAGSSATLKKIGDAVYARAGDLETVAEALNKLQGHLNGQYDSLLGCMLVLAEQPVTRRTRSERVLGPGEVAVRLAKDYGELGETAHRVYGCIFADNPAPVDELVRRIISVGRLSHEQKAALLPPERLKGTYSAVLRDGIPRPHAYGTPHCSVRMKLRPW
jgi:hypothetical protein